MVQRIPGGPGQRWLYELVPTSGVTAVASSRNWNEGTVTLPNGAVVDPRVTDDQVVCGQTEETGEYYWGADTGDWVEKPLVMVSLPLKLGRVWTTGDHATPAWYRYEVETIEWVETVAGQLDAG